MQTKVALSFGIFEATRRPLLILYSGGEPVKLPGARGKVTLHTALKGRPARW